MAIKVFGEQLEGPTGKGSMRTPRMEGRMKEIRRWTQPGSEGSQRGEEAPARPTPGPNWGSRGGQEGAPHPSPTRAQRVAGCGEPGRGAWRRRGKGLPSSERTGRWTWVQPLLTPSCSPPPGSHARLFITRRLPGVTWAAPGLASASGNWGAPSPLPGSPQRFARHFPFSAPLPRGTVWKPRPAAPGLFLGTPWQCPGLGLGLGMLILATLHPPGLLRGAGPSWRLGRGNTRRCSRPSCSQARPWCVSASPRAPCSPPDSSWPWALGSGP